MGKIITIILLSGMIVFQACEDLNVYNCDECLEFEPAMCDLFVNVSDTPAPHYVRIYMGTIEDSALFDERWVSSSFTISVFLNQEYTILSQRVVEDITYTAINSAMPRVKFDESYCEVACFFITDNSVDVRFKY